MTISTPVNTVDQKGNGIREETEEGRALRRAMKDVARRRELINRYAVLLVVVAVVTGGFTYWASRIWDFQPQIKQILLFCYALFLVVIASTLSWSIRLRRWIGPGPWQDHLDVRLDALRGYADSLKLVWPVVPSAEKPSGGHRSTDARDKATAAAEAEAHNRSEEGANNNGDSSVARKAGQREYPPNVLAIASVDVFVEKALVKSWT
jgi:hypothetical protein